MVSTWDGCTPLVQDRRDRTGTGGRWERRAVHKLERPHTPHRLASAWNSWDGGTLRWAVQSIRRRRRLVMELALPVPGLSCPRT